MSSRLTRQGLLEPETIDWIEYRRGYLKGAHERLRLYNTRIVDDKGVRHHDMQLWPENRLWRASVDLLPHQDLRNGQGVERKNWVAFLKRTRLNDPLNPSSG